MRCRVYLSNDSGHPIWWRYKGASVWRLYEGTHLAHPDLIRIKADANSTIRYSFWYE